VVSQPTDEVCSDTPQGGWQAGVGLLRQPPVGTFVGVEVELVDAGERDRPEVTAAGGTEGSEVGRRQRRRPRLGDRRLLGGRDATMASTPTRPTRAWHVASTSRSRALQANHTTTSACPAR
jgi:hypothetical protein